MNQKIIAGVLFLLLINLAFADLIALNTHPVEKCATLDNLDSFQDYVLVGKITGPMIDSIDFDLSEIKQNECLSKGYKYNQIQLYAIDKNYFNNTKKEDIDFNSSYVFKADTVIEPYGGYVDDSNPLKKIEVVYSIKSINGGVMILEKVSEINISSTDSDSDDQNPDANKTPVLPIDQKPKSIFEIISCFFMGIFGMSC